MTPADVDRLVHVAASRITLRVAAETHRLLGDFQAWLLWEVRKSVRDGFVHAPLLWAKGEHITAQWRAVTAQWRIMLSRAQEEAALLPFAGLWHRHNTYAAAWDEARIQAHSVAQHWLDVRSTVLRAVNARTYADNLDFSGRVWRLDTGALRGMQDIIRLSFSERTNAAELSLRLENFLGVNQDLPRWTLARLYRMTPRQRAKDLSGLLREPEMRSRGLAYKALRLARTEIQYANHAANDAVAAASPWITGKYVRLSPAHPKIDVCDDYAAGGPYTINAVILPLHANCMCYAEYATEPPALFKRRADAWAQGSGEREIDAYLHWAGLAALEVLPQLPGVSGALDAWLAGRADEHAARLSLRAVEHPPVEETAELRAAAAALAGA